MLQKIIKTFFNTFSTTKLNGVYVMMSTNETKNVVFFEQNTNKNRRVTGQKRRSWILNNQNIPTLNPIPNGVDQPHSDPIPNGVDQPHSDHAPNGVDQPHLNPLPNGVDQPHSDPTPNGVDQPHSDPLPNGVDQPHLNPLPNGVDQPHLNPLPNGVDQPHLNPLPNGVDQPHLKSLPNGVDQPHLKKFSIAITNPSQIQLSDLKRNPLKIVHYIYKNYCEIEKESKKITKTELMRTLDISINSLKTAIKFLIRNGILMRKKVEVGKNGNTVYEFSNGVYNEIKKNHKILFSNSTFKKNRMGSILSSSSNYKTTTTDEDERKTERKIAGQTLSEEWQSIDYGCLMSIGFGSCHLLQISNLGKFTAKEVQESIHAFAFTLTQPEIMKGIRADPLTYFMGILVKRGEPYLPPAGYQSPNEINMAAEKERLEKELKLKNELKDLKFEDWYASLTIDEKEKLTNKEMTNEMRSVFFSEGGYIPEQVREKKRKEVLKPYYLNKIYTQQ
jgi:predicted transcriptional regulator